MTSYFTRNVDLYELEAPYFYDDLEDGEYIVIDAIKLEFYEYIIPSHRGRKGYDRYFLIYNEKKKELLQLYPCYYTEYEMMDYWNLAKDEYTILKFEKTPPQPGAKTLPLPKWHKVWFFNYFQKGQQFRYNPDDGELELITCERKGPTVKAISSSYMETEPLLTRLSYPTIDLEEKARRILLWFFPYLQ